MINLSICGAHEAPQIASQTQLTDIISIGDPDGYPALCAPQPMPDFSASGAKVHRFEFQDVAHECETGPTAAHVKRIIDLADELIARPDDVHLLVHCQAGISRSTCAAFILAVRTGLTYQQAYDYIRMIRGVLNPNLLMAKHADILMGHSGKFLEFIVKNRWGGSDPHAIEWARQHGYVFPTS